MSKVPVALTIWLCVICFLCGAGLAVFIAKPYYKKKYLMYDKVAYNQYISSGVVDSNIVWDETKTFPDTIRSTTIPGYAWAIKNNDHPLQERLVQLAGISGPYPMRKYSWDVWPVESNRWREINFMFIDTSLQLSRLIIRDTEDTSIIMNIYHVQR